MDEKLMKAEIRTHLEYGRQAEKVILQAVAIIRESNPEAAKELLQHPDYLELLVTRTKLEGLLNE